MNTSLIKISKNKLVYSPLFVRKKRNPEITGEMLTFWFEYSFDTNSKEFDAMTFKKLSDAVYRCIIDVDDQIDLCLGDTEKVSEKYLKKINTLSYHCGLSDNFRKSVYVLYKKWMLAEDILSNNYTKKVPLKLLHKCYRDKVGFLKLIPIALGEMTGEKEKSESICQAYDYAGMANGYIDDLIDFEEDSNLLSNTNLICGLKESRKNLFLKNYIKNAIQFNNLAAELFNKQKSYKWKNHCDYQSKGCAMLITLLNTFDFNYILKNSSKYLKGT